ncbi:PQQ-binding-like beta-propeller repeat protein, partial [uncultured Abyssibacter sp.]|uniref:outer membrane protein assembly factor BamB family protein n=1 Tax=uncultured Abyssibacter sp. TaxID=2320202 RepID=UPI0032B2EC96
MTTPLSFRSFGVIVLACIATTAVAGPDDVNQLQFGTKYSELKQINRDNVSKLTLAWEYHTGDVPPADSSNKLIAFEDTPSMIDGNLVVCTTRRRLIALDPATGKKRWTYDPEDPVLGMQKCRGIANWHDDEAEDGAMCQSRIFMGTADYRLVAIDTKTGKPCPTFGDGGAVKMPATKEELFPGELVATSRPAIVNDVVVVGSIVADNQREEAPSGRVLAFDARSGEQLWSFDPLPRDPEDPAASSWARGTAEGYGAGNVWASMAVDEAMDMVYLPTTSPSGDFFGGGRAGD